MPFCGRCNRTYQGSYCFHTSGARREDNPYSYKSPPFIPCPFCNKSIPSGQFLAHFLFDRCGEYEFEPIIIEKESNVSRRDQALLNMANQDVSPNERDIARQKLREKGLWSG